jgi:hypoxanthine phosphoribosyltransferase
LRSKRFDAKICGVTEPRLETLITPEQIARRVRELGQQISHDYAGRQLVLLCVLKGSFVFSADLARAIDLPTRIEFFGVQSYGNHTQSSGIVQITLDLTQPIQDEDVLIVEDIVDSGLTLSYIVKQLEARRPKSLKVCSMLQKPARAPRSVEADYVGFPIDDVFVVGYGLDFAQRYRNLPGILRLILVGDENRSDALP